ncbi:MAG: hypothetical protein JXR95_11625 [Deltaproteobacteria bacterium]|nr:hypothetical protein [Deltaproteobacteria bacterium]
MKVIISYFLFFSTILLFSCQTPSQGPKETAVAFASYILSDLTQEAWKLLDSETQNKILLKLNKSTVPGLKPHRLLVTVPQSRDKWSGEKKIELIEENDNTARVRISVGKKMSVILNLLKEKGEWKVSLNIG